MGTVYAYMYAFLELMYLALRAIADRYHTHCRTLCVQQIAQIDIEIDQCIGLIQCLRECESETEVSRHELRQKHLKAIEDCKNVPAEYTAEIEGYLALASERRGEVEVRYAALVEQRCDAEEKLRKLRQRRSLLAHVLRDVQMRRVRK
jgi:hypothetical protein